MDNKLSELSKPVAYIGAQMLEDLTDGARSCGRVWARSEDELSGDDRLALYAAPPAPAVVRLPTEFYSDEGMMVQLEKVMAALAIVGVQYERKGEACRAAMLAQPVSQYFKSETNINTNDEGAMRLPAAPAAVPERGK